MKRKQALQATALFIATTLCFSSCRQELPNPWADPYDPFAAMTEEETKKYEENLRIILANRQSDGVYVDRIKEVYIDDYEAYQHFVEHGNVPKEYILELTEKIAELYNDFDEEAGYIVDRPFIGSTYEDPPTVFVPYEAVASLGSFVSFRSDCYDYEDDGGPPRKFYYTVGSDETMADWVEIQIAKTEEPDHVYAAGNWIKDGWKISVGWYEEISESTVPLVKALGSGNEEEIAAAQNTLTQRVEEHALYFEPVELEPDEPESAEE